MVYIEGGGFIENVFEYCIEEKKERVKVGFLEFVFFVLADETSAFRYYVV